MAPVAWRVGVPEAISLEHSRTQLEITEECVKVAFDNTLQDAGQRAELELHFDARGVQLFLDRERDAFHRGFAKYTLEADRFQQPRLIMELRAVRIVRPMLSGYRCDRRSGMSFKNLGDQAVSVDS